MVMVMVMLVLVLVLVLVRHRLFLPGRGLSPSPGSKAIVFQASCP